MEKNIQELLTKPLREVENLSVSDKKRYYEELRDYCKAASEKYKTDITLPQRIMAKIGKGLRNFDIEIIGRENMPKDGCLVVCNHSNTHDAFLAAEVLYKVGVPSSFLAGIEGLSRAEIALLKSARATMISRNDKESTINGVCDFSSKLIGGDTCVIYGEGTWNLHPFKPMQNIKIGASKIVAIAEKPIVPVIYEYVEIPDLTSKEKDLYTKCIITIGKPIIIDSTKSLIEQTVFVQTTMENMRKELWRELGTYRERKEDVNPEIYVNHTWLKKFGTPLFSYDSELEMQMLFSKDGTPVENEYCIDENGDFKPGIVLKKSKVKGIY